MFAFDNINIGNNLVTGLTNELESIYLNDIFKQNNSNFLVVTSSTYEANKLYSTLLNYNENVFLFLMDDFVASEADIVSPEFLVNRLETLIEIVSNNTKKIIVTNLMGFLRFLPEKESFINNIIKLKKGMEIDKNNLYSKLCNIGYKKEILVTKTGDISNRGFVLDIFPITSYNAVRIEFWGDTIESIKYFDVDTQLSIAELNEIIINPFSEFITDKNVENNKQKYLPLYEKVSSLNNYLNNPIIVYKDYNQIYNSYLLLCEDINNYKSLEKIEKYMFNLEEIFEKTSIYLLSVDNILPNVKIDSEFQYSSCDIVNFDDNFEALNTYLTKSLEDNKKVIICLNSINRFNLISKYLTVPYIETDFENIKNNKVNVIIKKINAGFEYNNYVVLSEKNMFKNIKIKSSFKSKFKFGTKISDLKALKVGDYVVHNSHGIGKYVGIVVLKKNGIVKDYLQIEYLNKEKLYIPVEKIELINKYSTSDGIAPKLNKLGGTEWQKTKLRVKGKLESIAYDIIKVAAERKQKKGFSFSKTVEEEVFAKDFLYTETSDQLKAIDLISSNMEKEYPMDMLLCGDVGYGKTEVAFRAMFKAVMSGKQVAYLCPTTILSNQQYNEALSRFSNFAINIALINRFTSKKDQNEITKKLSEGKIDIVFGTHRLLSDDVLFKDLGLLVIDEEQRFGVVNKEKIKKYKTSIDVLTLSATPIPRTLQMSLVGIRDLALIETPPIDRYPVQTYVLAENDFVIRDAIYKELSRNGQVFILCNKIETFEQKKDLLYKLVPDAKIGFAHGKMDKNEIEDTMIKFVNMEYDVLICTTIIETGIDIPNANTLIIFDADKFGLGQLYQIRGRVGRSDRVAYAYLMYQKNKVLSEIANKRLSAIKEFASLGSGFKIAMKDLSIRGAGDVLGTEQSGFIDQIGVDLYLKFLNEEIEKINGNHIDETEDSSIDTSLSVTTHIDNDYVKEDELKIEIHKLINEIDSFESLEEIKNEIEDRFGKISESLLIYMYEELFDKMKNKKGIEKIEQNERFIKLIFDKEFTTSIKVDELFINAYKLCKNFKFAKEFNRLTITLNINNLDKHWIFYLVEILNLL